MSHTWEICSMVHEAPELIVAFVAHHIELGPERIRLFLDRPQPEVQDLLANHPGVVIHVCDQAWWENLNNGDYPVRQGMRQRANLQWSMDNNNVDWVVHIDADEFLVAKGGQSLGDDLAKQPDNIDYVSFRVAERVYLRDPDTTFVLDGVFRSAAPNGKLERIAVADGDATPCLDRGLTGYIHGKSAVRVGRNLKAGIHSPKPPNAQRSCWLNDYDLLHYDGLTPQHWYRKKLRQLVQQPNAPKNDTPARRAQFAAIAARKDDVVALHKLYLGLKQLSSERRQALDKMGLLLHHDFDPRAAIARQFPDAEVDLSLARFDTYRIDL